MTPVKEQEDCTGIKHQKECTMHLVAVKDTMDILSGKWKIAILAALTFETYRFKELARLVGVTPKMLSKELKELEMNQLVKRTVYDTTPVTVEYSMTPYGKTLSSVLKEMHTWGAQHRKRIMKKGS